MEWNSDDGSDGRPLGVRTDACLETPAPVVGRELKSGVLDPPPIPSGGPLLQKDPSRRSDDLTESVDDRLRRQRRVERKVGREQKQDLDPE